MFNKKENTCDNCKRLPMCRKKYKGGCDGKDWKEMFPSDIKYRLLLEKRKDIWD